MMLVFCSHGAFHYGSSLNCSCLCRVRLSVANLFEESYLLNTLSCFRILHFMCINFCSSWTAEIFGCMVSVDYVLQLCVSLSMLSFTELVSLRTSTHFV